MTTNIRAADQQALQAMDEVAAKRPPDNVNELHIRVIRCTGLKPRRESMLDNLEILLFTKLQNLRLPQTESILQTKNVM